MKNHANMEYPAFVGYITAGYPDRRRSIEVLVNCCQAGLDILEVGFPAKDPSCDGAVIREAQKKVDRSVVLDMTYWRELRTEVDVPIWLMGYKDDLFEEDIYLKLAEEQLYDALVIPDLTEKEFAELNEKLRSYGVELVGFINPGLSDNKIRDIAKTCNLIYHQLYCGTTGQTHNDSSYLDLMNYARLQGAKTLYAGFGISTPERAAELAANGFDGVIIGSAIMKNLLKSETDAYAFIHEVKKAIEQRR